MSHTLKTALVLATTLSCSAFAGVAPEPSNKDIAVQMDEINFVETAQPGIILSGYVDAGYTYNFIGDNDALTARAFTDDAVPQGDFNMYAAKIVLEKPLSDKNELQAGFRTDIIVGEDANDLSNNNGFFSSDTVYLQQAYAQARLPWGNGLDIIAGKFQAVIGFEAEERPANPNITPGVVSLVDPSWYIGALATYPINDQITIALGGGNGSGVVDGSGLDTSSDQYALTGYIGFTAPGKNAETFVGFHYAAGGDAGYTGAGGENEPLLDLNWTGNWHPTFAGDKLMLAFNTSFATFNDFSAPNPLPANDSSTFFGVAIYAKYQATDLISLAGRAEYAHTDDSQFLSPLAPVVSGTNDIWTWTGTIGFDLTENLMLRAEYRIDFGDDVRVSPTASFDSAQMLSTEIAYSF